MNGVLGFPAGASRSLVELCVDVLVELHDTPDVEWSRDDDTGPDPEDVATLLDAAEVHGWADLTDPLRTWLGAHATLVEVLDDLDRFHATHHPADHLEAARLRAELRERMHQVRAARAALAAAAVALREPPLVRRLP